VIIRVEFTPFSKRIQAQAVKFLHEVGCTAFTWGMHHEIDFVEGRVENAQESNPHQEQNGGL